MKFSKAVFLSVVWVLAALLFNLGIYVWYSHQKALEFFTGYVVELSLSVDNLFVFYLIFSHFKVSSAHQVKVLNWGVWGAQFMRAVFILGGLSLLKHFGWIVYIFGAILIFSGVKLFFEKEKEIHPDENILLRLFKKWVRVDSEHKGDKFVVRHGKFWMATPLLVVLLIVETTDLLFAVDSIPAVLAITKDPLIVYSSNIFAILGLRAMYFVLSGVMDVFHHLHYGLGIILVFVGFKMVTEHIWHMSIGLTLGFIISVLIITIITSSLFPSKVKR